MAARPSGMSATPASLVSVVRVTRTHTCAGHAPANVGPKAEGYLASPVGHVIFLVAWPGGEQGELEAVVDPRTVLVRAVALPSTSLWPQLLWLWSPGLGCQHHILLRETKAARARSPY